MSKPLPLTATAPAPPPWWRVGTLWLVLLGPLLVVLASLVTAVIAFNGADQVLNDDRAAVPASSTPAITARNRAATP